MFTQFEIPVAHLPTPEVAPGAHYVPPRTLNPEEAIRRHGQKPGHLLAEQQTTGIRIAAETMRRLEAPEDIHFMADIFAVSGLNTAWYLYAEGAEMDVMRRHVDLPFMVGPTPHDRPTSRTVLRHAISELDYAAERSHSVERAIHYGSPRVQEFRPRAGRLLASAALHLGVVDLGDKFAGAPRVRDHQVQRMVRARSTRNTKMARSLQAEVGNYPSMAALAEPLSALRVYIGRQAPSQATLEAFNEAVTAATAA